MWGSSDGVIFGNEIGDPSLFRCNFRHLVNSYRRGKHHHQAHWPLQLFLGAWFIHRPMGVRFAAFAVREKCKAGAFIFPYRSPRSGPEPEGLKGSKPARKVSTPTIEVI
jgi:hypothetical protein